MKLEALIFDVDGTLADTEKDGHRVAFNKAFADAGLDWEWSVELYGELLAVTGGKERIRFYLERFNTGFEHPARPGRLYRRSTPEKDRSLHRNAGARGDPHAQRRQEAAAGGA